MFGENRVERQVLSDGTTLEINSIFKTIQGEGPWAGTPSVFVRLAGCNLKCFFCDTEFETRTIYKMSSVVEEVGRLLGKAKLVVLTGGEPFRQNIVPFVSVLLSLGRRVQIETDGLLWAVNDSHAGVLERVIQKQDDLISIVVSPKAVKVHPKIWQYAHAWKYIIRAGEVSEEDGLPLGSTQVKGRLAKLQRPGPHFLNLFRERVFVQPCDEYNEEKNKANVQAAVEVALKFGYRLSMQTHKMAGLP